MKAVAIVGAAAIGRVALGRMVVLVPAPPGVAKNPASRLPVGGTVTTVVGREPVTSPVSSFRVLHSPQ